MIRFLKVKRLVVIEGEMGILLEDGTILVRRDDDFIAYLTGQVFRPVVEELHNSVVGFSDTI